MRVCFYLLSLLCLSATSSAAEVTHLNRSGALPGGLPFSEAVRVDDTLYLSGQIGMVPGKGVLAEGGMDGEARQTMENIRAVLRANDLTMKDVVKCTVMLEDIAEWGAFNRVYESFFDAPYPARSAFGADGLALGARVEVECMAAYAR